MKRKADGSLSGGAKKKSKKGSKSPATWAGPSLRQRQESKSLDIVTTAAAITGGTGRVDTLNACATGDDFNNRDGRRIMMQSVYIRGQWGVNTVAGTQFGCVRIVVVYDKQYNGVEPVVTDVFVSNAATSHLNLNNRSRFQVVLDKTYPMSINGQGPAAHSFEHHRKLMLDTQYGGTTATAASITTGGLVMFLLSDVAGATTTCTFSTRVRFLDF